MAHLGQDMDTIPHLVTVNGPQDHQAAQIITLLLLQEDILLPPTHLVHQDHGVQHGPLNSLVSWGLHLPMVQLSLLHQVLMTCITGQDGPNQAMEVRVPHIRVRTLQVMEVPQDQYHLAVHLPAHLQEGHLHLQVPILPPRLEGHQFKDRDMGAVDNLLILINIK